MIIANHAHLMPPRGQGAWWPDGDSDMLLRHLDFCGIDMAVVFPPFACQCEGSMHKANTWAIGEVRKHADRLIPAGTIFPVANDVLEVLDMLNAEGVSLAKIHPSIDLHDVADPNASDCYAKAAALGIALDYHTGPHGTRLSFVEPMKYDNIAWDHPKLKLVFEHVGGRTFFEQFLAILANHPKGKVYAGITSVLSYETHKMWYLGPERITDMVRCIGADKLVFGLDFPWNPAEINKRDIEIIRSLDISEAEKSRILGENLAALAGPVH